MENADDAQATDSQDSRAPQSSGQDLLELLERGKLSLRAESSASGVLSSLSVIRKHISRLDTEDIAEFSLNLGAVIEFINLKFLRSAIMLGQNPKILEWLYKHINSGELQLYIIKVVGLIAVTVRFSRQIDDHIRELFVPVVCRIVRDSLPKKQRLKKLSLDRIDFDEESLGELRVQKIVPELAFLEDSDSSAGLLMYCLLILDKGKESLSPEAQVQVAEDLLSAVEVIANTFPRVQKSELKTILNNSINSVLKWIVTIVPTETLILRLPQFMMISLVFQLKTDFVYTLQGQLEEVIKQNKEKASLVLADLLSDKLELRNKILVHCTKLRSILFISTLLSTADPHLTKSFFRSGGRSVYMQILARHLSEDKTPNIYIFLEDEDLVQSMTAKEQELIQEVVKRITNAGVIRYQMADRLTSFNKALSKRVTSQSKHQPEFMVYSKVFKAKETAEIVMKGIVNNIWKENAPQSNNLIIEVKNKKQHRSVEIDLTSPAAFSANSSRSAIKSTQSGNSFQFKNTMVEGPCDRNLQGKSVVDSMNMSTVEPSITIDSLQRTSKKKKASLYSYDSRRELFTKDIGELMSSFYQYNSRTKTIDFYHDKETRLVYHRRIHDGKGLYFAVLEINNQVDLILLNAIVYSPHMRKVFVNTNIKTMERLNNEGRPFYEKDFVTLCTTTTSRGRLDYLIVILDKQEGVNKLLYNPLLSKGILQEYPDFEEVFTSYGTQFGSMRSLTLSSGLDSVLVGYKHLLAVFSANSNKLVFNTMVSDIGFTLSRIRLLDKQTNTFLVLGYVTREFNIINLAHKRIYNFVFEWLESNQLITEVEIDENIMVYLIEDSKRKHSSIYIRDNDSYDDQMSADDPN